MTLNATARSIPGTLRQEVVIDGKHHLITDEPEHLASRSIETGFDSAEQLETSLRGRAS